MSAQYGITWLTDEQLLPSRLLGLRGDLGLMRHLLEAETCAERQRLVRERLQAIGFAWLAYGKVSLQGGRPVPRLFFAGYADPRWTQTYFGERLYEVDPRHQEASPSGLPMAWDIDDLETAAGAQGGPRRQRFFEQLRASGAGSGVFISLPSATRPLDRTVISLTAPARGWISDATLGQAAMLALCLHEYLGAQVRLLESGGATATLSPTQREILRSLAMGQSDKEIAHELKLSAHTVDYHMRRLRLRFAARNRVQLVHAALRSLPSAA